jgi:hypothetical protein
VCTAEAADEVPDFCWYVLWVQVLDDGCALVVGEGDEDGGGEIFLFFIVVFPCTVFHFLYFGVASFPHFEEIGVLFLPGLFGCGEA